MATFEFRPAQIQNIVIPNLKDGISSLVLAINEMDSIIIPESFKYKSQLIQARIDLNNSKVNLTNEQEHLTNTVNIITKTSNEFEKYVSLLPVTEITKRVSKI